MSSVGSVGTGYGFLNSLVAHAASLHQQLNTMTAQASTGLVAETYAGLGADAGISLKLNPQLAALQTYQDNIDQATGQMQVTQTAMTQLQSIGATFVAAMPKLNSLTPENVDSYAAQARDALVQVAGLLNTKNGDVYVFAGQDTANPPVPSPDSILASGFYTQINAEVSALSVNGAATTIANTLAIAQSDAAGTSPFSTYLSQPTAAIGQQVVQTGDGSTVRIGLLASANSDVASTGTSTTGSYMRDLMRALATIGSLSGAQANDPNFATLIEDTRTSLTNAVSAMAADVGVLGNRQSALTGTKAQLTDTAMALTAQVSAVQDVDMAAALSSLTAIQTQLQMSYRMIVNQGTLSLASFLPVA
jgi:flagellar hook-associated protein 3 FlgL